MCFSRVSQIKRTHTHIFVLNYCCGVVVVLYIRTDSCQQIHSFNGLLKIYYNIRLVYKHKSLGCFLESCIHCLPACFVCFSGSFILFLFNSCRVCSFLVVFCVCVCVCTFHFSRKMYRYTIFFVFLTIKAALKYLPKIFKRLAKTSAHNTTVKLIKKRCTSILFIIKYDANQKSCIIIFVCAHTIHNTTTL